MSQFSSKSTEDSKCHLASIRLLIADDQPRVRQSLEALLTELRRHTANCTAAVIEIVGKANDGQQAVQQVQALHPDVVVLDLPTHNAAIPSAPWSSTKSARPESKLDGLTVIRLIKSQWPEIRIVVLTMYATDRSAVLLAGADAFLLKGCPTNDLLEAVTPTV
ncbi:response regulator [bacterium]|nr:response regulator [bacterium]